MTSRRTIIAVSLIIISMCAILSFTQQPQLSIDEQNLIVESVVKTINPDAMVASIAATVESRIMANLGLEVPNTDDSSSSKENIIGEESAIAATETPMPILTNPNSSNSESIRTSASGPAILKDDGTYSGLHGKFVNSYAYTVGGDSGKEKSFESEYTPNVVFNIDVVFENDGDVVWPPSIEMRNTGNSGTYTGHRASVLIDRSSNPIKPGDRCGFSLSAHGSEDLGYHTFYFQLYDGVSGSLIEGASGSFSYLAK